MKDKGSKTGEGNEIIPDTPSAYSYESETEKPIDWTHAVDPIALFTQWLKEAGKTEAYDPNAMSLATVDDEGLPDVRIVLLKGFDERGFVFYSNSESAKGQQLKQNKAALCFHWKTQKRQVRVRGFIERVSDEDSDAYFAKRARGSRIGAWASHQSRPVQDRETMLSRVENIKAQFPDDVPRPPHWYGWRVLPQTIEFWQDGAFRLHDRMVFSPENEGWAKTRLWP